MWKSALSHELQQDLLSAISNQCVLDPASGRNQAMGFGVLPDFVHPLFTIGKRILPSPLSDRTPVFDQMILNHYYPGDGIKPHLDLARFEDGVLIASFLSSTVMEFRTCDEDEGFGYDLKESHSNKIPVDILLEPGDVVCLSGDARYRWTHAIAHRDRDKTMDSNGKAQVLERGERISITLRRLTPEGT
ncbi:hypothetical protein HDU67_009947 [Dinochytrium kinnereticum]|nr:hypothetical protein HDU67_009947 [Dinochytrium kinnereticum]